jgi:hypothetical protein
VTAVTDLAERIAAHLDAALASHERAGFGAPTVSEQRGLAVGGPFAPRIVLAVRDVARLAAQAAEEVSAREEVSPAEEVRTDPPEPQDRNLSPSAADPWSARLAGYRRALIAERDRLGERIEQAEARFDAVGPEHRDHIESLAARIPDLGGSPTEIEYLTWRAAEADRDLALVRYEVALTEAGMAVRDLGVQQSQLDLRIGQVDHLTGDDPFGIGGDEHLAILMIDLEGANLEAFAAARTAELARKRLAEMTTMHDKIHARLRDVDPSARAASD